MKPKHHYHHRQKNTLYLGIVAAIAILVGYYLYDRANYDYNSEVPPALQASKLRNSPTPTKIPSKTPYRRY